MAGRHGQSPKEPWLDSCPPVRPPAHSPAHFPLDPDSSARLTGIVLSDLQQPETRILLPLPAHRYSLPYLVSTCLPLERVQAPSCMMISCRRYDPVVEYLRGVRSSRPACDHDTQTDDGIIGVYQTKRGCFCCCLFEGRMNIAAASLRRLAPAPQATPGSHWTRRAARQEDLDIRQGLFSFFLFPRNHSTRALDPNSASSPSSDSVCHFLPRH